MVLGTRRHQGVGDLLAGTVVIRDPTRTGLPPALWFPVPWGLDGFAATIDPTAMTVEQYTVVRLFLVRMLGLPPTARSAIATDLAGSRRPHGAPSVVPPGTPRGVPAVRHRPLPAAQLPRRTSRARRRAPSPPPFSVSTRSTLVVASLRVTYCYLDHAATTPMRPEAVEAMLPFLTERFANPSGSHRFAREARRSVDEARDVVAAAIGCRPGEVVFTGGGTEADNAAVFGAVDRRGGVPVCSRRRAPRRARRGRGPPTV